MVLTLLRVPHTLIKVHLPASKTLCLRARGPALMVEDEWRLAVQIGP